MMKNRIRYAGAMWMTPLPWAMACFSIYMGLKGPVYSQLVACAAQAAQPDAGLIPGLVDIWCRFLNLMPSLFNIFLPIILFLSPIIWYVSKYCWLAEPVHIPAKNKDGHPLNDKVILSLTSIFNHSGDLALSYNRNNIAGGFRMLSDDGKPYKHNLMSQFMSRYFGGGRALDMPFNWSKFQQAYDDDCTRIYYVDACGDLREIDKTSIPLSSFHPEHHAQNPALDPASQAERNQFPIGTVIALKMPQGCDRQYAYLLCNTAYDVDKADCVPSTNIEWLDACLTTLWKVVLKTSPTKPQRLCLPFLGKGYAGLHEHAYGVLWAIVFSYRKAVSHHANPPFGVNICIRPSTLSRSQIKLHEITGFLTYALRG